MSVRARPTTEAPRFGSGRVVRLLAAAAIASAMLAPAAAESPPRAARPPSAHELGGLLYFVHCARCHGAGGSGGGPDAELFTARPPDLRGERLVAAQGRAWVAKVRDGRAVPLELRAGAVERRAEDTEALFRHLSRLPSVSWKTVDRGREIFLSRCSACHGMRGTPQGPLPRGVQGAPRDLAAPDFQSSIGDRRLLELVRHGGKHMPALTPRLSPAEAESVAAFVRQLSPGYALYDRLCSTCHGNHGEGGLGALQEAGTPPVAFDERFFDERDSDEIRRRIWHMVSSAESRMPHFSATLDAARVEAILRWLSALPEPKGAAPR